MFFILVYVRVKLEFLYGVILIMMMIFIYINKMDYYGEVIVFKIKVVICDIYLFFYMMNDIEKYLKWYKENNVYKDDYVLFGIFFKVYSELIIDCWFIIVLKVLDE